MLDTARPVAYIRRSVIRKGNEGDLSREFQVAEVRRLAGDDGPGLAVIDGDWGRSARHDKTDKRLAFLSMLETIERGEVSTLYAFAIDRLARSVEWSARLLNACEKAGTTIVTSEGRFAPDDDGPRVTFQILAVMNENAVRAMGRKARATVDRRNLRGDKRGSPPYGWRLAPRNPGEVVTWEPDPTESVETVLEAYREAGSFHGAARLLNERKIKAPRGDRWYGSRVRDLLKATHPDATEVRQTTARVAYRSSSGAIFRRLLLCHCGGIPTPNRQRSGTFYYRCPRGHSDRAGHPVVQIPERVVLDWAKAEAARLQLPGDVVAGADDPTLRAELLAKRERVADALLAGLIDKARAMTERDAIDAEIDRLDSAQGVTVLPPAIDWTWQPVRLNDVLRALWESIELGPDLTPTAATWRVPEWRA